MRVTQQCGFKIIEAGRPEALIVGKPAVGFGQWPRLNATTMRAAFDCPAEKTRLFQHFHVLGRCCEGHVEWLGKLAHAVLAISQLAQHSATSGVGERMEHAIESRGIIFNHIIEYNASIILFNHLV